MIIDKNKTYIVNKIGQNLVLIGNELYFLYIINGINFLICLNNTNLIISNATTGIGFSCHNGVMIGVKFTTTPTTPSYLLLETGDFVLLEDGSKILLQR